jgi:hypothetical protein
MSPAAVPDGFTFSVPAVRVEGVVKRFGATAALDGAGLEVPAGMVFGPLRWPPRADRLVLGDAGRGLSPGLV